MPTPPNEKQERLLFVDALRGARRCFISSIVGVELSDSETRTEASRQCRPIHDTTNLRLSNYMLKEPFNALVFRSGRRVVLLWSAVQGAAGCRELVRRNLCLPCADFVAAIRSLP
jgi:hypothetical protein